MRYKFEKIPGAHEPEERRTLGNALRMDVDAAIRERAALADRWRVNTAYYENNPPRWVNRLLPGCEMMHFPLTQPKIDRMAGTTVRTIFNVDPINTAQLRGANGRQRDLERGIQFFREIGGLEQRVRSIGTISALTDACVLKCTFDIVTDQEHDRKPDNVTLLPGFASYAGFRYEVKHPDDFVIFPASPFGMQSAKLVGDRFWVRESTVKARQADGTYFKDAVVSVSAGPQNYASRDYNMGRLAPGMAGSDDTDQLVECFDLLVKLRLEPDGKLRRYQVTLAYDTSAILCIKRYYYSKPWYREFRFKDVEYGSYWSSRSVAQDLQGLQRAYNHLNNLLIYGSYVAALPAVFGRGLPSKATKYMAGDVFNLDDDTTVTTVDTRFDPAAIPLMCERIERLADAVVRITQIATGQQTKAGTSATEVAELMRAQGTNDNDYLVNFGQGLMELADIEREQLFHNFAYWKPLYMDQVPIIDPSILAMPVRWSLQGKNPNTTPEVHLAKFEALLEKAVQFPMLMDVQATLRCYVNAMETGNEDQIMPEQPVMTTGPAAGLTSGALNELVPQLTNAAGQAGFGGSERPPLAIAS